MPKLVRSLGVPFCVLVMLASIPLGATAAGSDDKPNIVYRPAAEGVTRT